MRYPVAIELGNENSSFGVVVPDLPGCFSAGATLEEAIDNAKEAILLHIEGLIAEGQPVPRPGTIDAHVASDEFDGWTWAILDVDLNELSGKSARINISLPDVVVAYVDAVAARTNETRSGFLARAALTLGRESTNKSR